MAFSTLPVFTLSPPSHDAAESGKFDAFELFHEAEGDFPDAERWQRSQSVAAKKTALEEMVDKRKKKIVGLVDIEDWNLDRIVTGFDTKKDDMLGYKMERVPFLEEQVRKVKDGGQLLGMDIERLLLSEDNRFDFVNDVAAEAIEYVENNRDEYGGKKKAILQVISNRVNDAGFFRPEAYEESDPFKPGPSYLKEEFT